MVRFLPFREYSSGQEEVIHDADEMKEVGTWMTVYVEK